jgi:hypothetical protein
MGGYEGWLEEVIFDAIVPKTEEELFTEIKKNEDVQKAKKKKQDEADFCLYEKLKAKFEKKSLKNK